MDEGGIGGEGSPLAELLRERVDRVLAAWHRAEPGGRSQAAVEGFLAALEALEQAAETLASGASPVPQAARTSSWEDLASARSYAHLAGLLPRALERAVTFDAAAAVLLRPGMEPIVDAVAHADSGIEEVVRARALQVAQVLRGGVEDAAQALPPRPSQLASALYVPLVAWGEVMGVTYIASARPDAFTAADAAMLSDLAAHASGAFHRLDSAVRAVRATPRQSQVLSLVAAGLSDKEIAARLGMSMRTVRTHLERVLRQHGMSSRTEAATAWLRGEPR